MISNTVDRAIKNDHMIHIIENNLLTRRETEMEIIAHCIIKSLAGHDEMPHFPYAGRTEGKTSLMDGLYV